MELKATISLNINLTPSEFRLVCAGLLGKLTAEQKVEALELQDRLFKARNSAVKNQLQQVQKMMGES